MGTQVEKIKRIAGVIRRGLNPLVFLGPIGVTLIVAFLLTVDENAGFYAHLAKNTMEVVSLFVLIPAALVAFIRFCISRNYFFLWLTGLIMAVIFREIHWKWTSEGIYALLVLLFLVAYLFFDRLKPYISSATFVNIIVSVFFFYFISEMLLDHNWLRIPAYHVDGASVRSALEECVEVLGHFVLSVSVLLIPPMAEDY